MPQIRIPRVFRNHCGTYCFRLKQDGRERRISLHTKCPLTAAILAFDLNARVEKERALKNPKLSDLGLNPDPDKNKQYEADMMRGIFRADGPEDHARMMDMLGKVSPMLPLIQQAAATPAASAAASPTLAVPLKSKKIEEVVGMWLAERKLKNAPRTVYAKLRHFKDFTRRVVEDVPINSLAKANIVAYKTALLNDGQKAKTIDNKLMSLHDLFKYALANGLYTISNENPVSGLFLLTQKERANQNEPYIPFEQAEIKAFFAAPSYIQQMNTPDLFWPPLLALYSGMRISEATAIRVKDVRLAENGVHYIHIPKSKTTAGIRNVPVCDALINLGFLEYVEEAREGVGATGRIFPHCLWINGTYSKELSKVMLERLIDLGIREEGDDLNKSFHSIRVNVITALANKGANTAQTMQITGHKTEQGANVKTHLDYVRDLPDLKEVVDVLSWPVDIAALKYDGRWKGFLASPANHAPDGDVKKKPVKKRAKKTVKKAAK
jgi:integrase